MYFKKLHKDGKLGIWILYGVLLTVNFLNVNEQRTTVAERH